MSLQQALPILIAIAVVALILLRHRRPRTVRPQFMWVVPVLVVPVIGMGLYFTPHQPFGPVAWVVFAAALALGAAAGWWRGRTITIQKASDGTLKAQASPLGLVLILGLLAVRGGLRSLMESHAAAWHVDVAVITDAFLLFAVGMIVAQRVEMFIRARRVQTGGVDTHLELSA